MPDVEEDVDAETWKEGSIDSRQQLDETTMRTRSAGHLGEGRKKNEGEEGRSGSRAHGRRRRMRRVDRSAKSTMKP